MNEKCMVQEYARLKMEKEVFGLEVDFRSQTYTRLAGAKNLTMGKDFDKIPCFGGRRRCVVTDDGAILAYYGEEGYTQEGVLEQKLIVGEEEYLAGTPVQVMVYQPAFYYKVVPLEKDVIADGTGFHLRKAGYLISTKEKQGFRLHPAFIRDGKKLPYILKSAFEGSLYDPETKRYNLADEQVMEEEILLRQQLSSIASAKPASGLAQSLSCIHCTKIAQNRGPGWSQEYAASAAATQLLMLIEFGTMDMQHAVGRGVVDVEIGTGNEAFVTGKTSPLGNQTGMTAGENGYAAVSYRGEENPWGNMWIFVDGLRIHPYGIHDLYVAEDAFEKDDSYKKAGFTLAKENGFITAFGYSEQYDWLFMPSETVAEEQSSIGDYYWQNNSCTTGYLVPLVGGAWVNRSNAGGFSWAADPSSVSYHRDVGGRLVYRPKPIS